MKIHRFRLCAEILCLCTIEWTGEDGEPVSIFEFRPYLLTEESITCVRSSAHGLSWGRGRGWGWGWGWAWLGQKYTVRSRALCYNRGNLKTFVFLNCAGQEGLPVPCQETAYPLDRGLEPVSITPLKLKARVHWSDLSSVREGPNRVRWPVSKKPTSTPRGKPKCSVPRVRLESTTHRSGVERATNWATPVPPEDHITPGPQQGGSSPNWGDSR